MAGMDSMDGFDIMKTCKGCRYLTPSNRHCRYGVPDRISTGFSYATGKNEERLLHVLDCKSLTDMRGAEGRCGPEAKLYEDEEKWPLGCLLVPILIILIVIALWNWL
jgi:hypothetical protein